MTDKIFLSPSSLNLYLECPRCFWLKFNKNISKPAQPASTLPRGVDLTLKNYFDSCREKGLPEKLDGSIKGKLLQDKELLKKIRGRTFGVNINEEIRFNGSFDEAIELEDGSIVPLDNKTKGFPIKETHWTYISQMSGYSLILKERGIKTKPLAYLAYWYFDHKNMDFNNPLNFYLQVENVKTFPEQTKKRIYEAVECLKRNIPEPGNKSGIKGNEPCHFCSYRKLDF